MITFREAVVSASDYYAGDMTDAGVRIRAHRNESPLPPPAHVVEALRAIDADLLRFYPVDLQRRFTKRLAKRIGVRVGNLAVANGADEILLAVARAVLEPGDGVVTVRPTFGMYARAARLAGAALREARYTERWKFDPYALLRLVDERTKLVVLGHPNNPTGEALDPQALELIARKAPQALVVVDEIYLSLRGGSLVRFAGLLPNVVVVGSLSKASALAGLRVGYAVANPWVARMLRRAIAPYPLASASLVAANAYLADPSATAAFEDAFSEQVTRSLETIVAAFAPFAVSIWRGAANFALADLGAGVLPLAKALRRRGIAVRTFAHEELASCVRFCALDDRSTVEFADALTELVPQYVCRSAVYA